MKSAVSQHSTIRIALASIAQQRGYATLEALAHDLPDVPRARLASWWHDRASTIDISTLDILLAVLKCQIGDLLIYEQVQPVAKRYTTATFYTLGLRQQHTQRRRRPKPRRQ